MDRNDCRFVGRIGSPIKKDKTQNGDDYMWFLLELESRANATSTENNYRQQINIMCFKGNVIKYLERIHAHQGNTVVIFGFVSAFPTEINGKQIVANGINANEIYVVQTKPI